MALGDEGSECPQFIERKLGDQSHVVLDFDVLDDFSQHRANGRNHRSVEHDRKLRSVNRNQLDVLECVEVDFVEPEDVGAADFLADALGRVFERFKVIFLCFSVMDCYPRSSDCHLERAETENEQSRVKILTIAKTYLW